MLAKQLAVVGALAATAAAHGTVTGIVADGTYVGGWLLQYYYSLQNGQSIPDTPGWYAEDLDNGFVSPDNYTGADIICHKNAKNANGTATVKAGGTVDFEWTTWPDSHIGPVITYVAKCDADCKDADKTALKWVKIAADGYDASTKTWATTTMIANNNTASVTVPSTLAAGNYVFRHEIIALHGAESENGAQNYPQCLNIAITGDGTDNPEGTLGEALYTPTDAGILFNPYGSFDSYTIPGPALYGSSSSSSGTTTAASSAAASVAASTSAAVASSSAVVSSVQAAATTEAASSTVTPTSVVASSAAVSSAAATTAAAVATSAAPVVSQIAGLSTALPSGILTSALPTGTPSASSNYTGEVPSKALPEGITLADLLEWVSYYLGEFFAKEQKSSHKGHRRHARDIVNIY